MEALKMCHGHYLSAHNFWPDRPTSRARFNKVSLDLASLTSYQPMVEFSSHFDHFHIFDQLTFLVRSAKFWRWFSQFESGFDLSNLLSTYGTFFR